MAELADLIPCGCCGCFFITEKDLGSHAPVCPGRLEGWSKSDWDKRVEIKHSSKDPQLKRFILQNGSGWVPLGNFEYSVSGNGEWLKRRLLSVR